MFKLIISNPEILGGKPCVTGTRISVEFILELMASGATRQDILTAYPQPPPLAHCLHVGASDFNNHYGL